VSNEGANSNHKQILHPYFKF